MPNFFDMSDEELIDALSNWTFFDGVATGTLINAAKVRLKLKLLQIESLKKSPEGTKRP